MVREQDFYDVVIVGGGHNGLVAAAYLAGAGLTTLVLEQQSHTGGAAVSQQVFPGVDARLSRYSYLVSLLPDKIVADLGLSLELRSRSVASYTPVRRGGRDLGLMVERPEGTATRESFAALTGGDAEYEAWTTFYGSVGASWRRWSRRRCSSRSCRRGPSLRSRSIPRCGTPWSNGPSARSSSSGSPTTPCVAWSRRTR